MKKKPMEKLTKMEYSLLKRMGMLLEMYPEAPDNYEEIKLKKVGE